MIDVAALVSFLSPPFPPVLWYGPFLFLGLLGVAALCDAFRGRVPDLLVFAAFGGVLALSLAYEGSLSAGQRLIAGFLAFWLLKGVDTLYYALFHRDAFGMGDAKWTAAAAAGFGLNAVFWAWIFGAWAGLSWFVLRAILGVVFPRFRARGYVHFAPFLFFGLCFKLYGAEILMRLS